MENNYSQCRSAMRDLSGGFGHTQDILASLKAALFNGLPVCKNITSYWRTKNGKTECSNIAAVVAELEKERPLIFSAVLEVSTFTGHHAREKLNTAFDMLYDDSKNHRLIIYAIMCYIWAINFFNFKFRLHQYMYYFVGLYAAICHCCIRVTVTAEV